MPQQCDVLVIDDDEAIRTILAGALNDEGFSTCTAANGELGLQVARSGTPKIIILDMTMPVMNGWEFLATIKKDPSLSRIPVIQISAANDVRTPSAVGFLTKPFSLDELLRRIRPYLAADA